MSTKLYGPDEGYATVITRINFKKSKIEEKKIRKQMADLIEDQEPVMKGPTSIQSSGSPELVIS